MKASICSSLLGMLIFGFSGVGEASPAGTVKKPETKAKTTVCSITINSSDEIETFKSHLNPDDHEFVELTKLGQENQENQENEAKGPKLSWMQMACKQKIKCDVLVISGHFGGTFFGSSGLKLGVEELEKYSCEADCDGVLQAPKEVFLFGCNTLAGKEQDRRTPEEYRRVLMADGFSHDEAEQVVAFRYSPLGDSFGERMRRIFRGTPRIYGFDSIAPTGAHIKGLLANYLKNVAPKKYYTPVSLQKLDEATNGELARALKVTALTQVKGANELAREQIPACYLNSNKVGFYHKLNWIQKNLNSSNSFQYLPAINEYLNSLTDANYQWRDKEFEVLERVIYNKGLRDRLEAIIKVRDQAMLGMQLKVLTFMKFFGWIYGADYIAKVQSLLIGDLNADFTIEQKDQICTYARGTGVKVDLPLSAIPAGRWQDPEFIEVLACSSLYRPDIFNKLMDIYLTMPKASKLSEASLSALTNFNVTAADVPSVLRRLVGDGTKLMTSAEKVNDFLCAYRTGARLTLGLPRLPENMVTNTDYLKVVGCFTELNPAIASQLAKVMRSSDTELQSAGISALYGYGSSKLPMDEPLIRAVFQMYRGISDLSVDEAVAGLFRRTDPLPAFARHEIEEVLNRDLDRLKLTTRQSEWINLLTMGSQGSRPLCLKMHAKADAEMAAGRLLVALQTLNLTAGHCSDTDLKERQWALDLKVIQAVAASNSHVDIASAGNMEPLMDNLQYMEDETSKTTFRVHTWSELWALIQINDASTVKRQGTSVDVNELFTWIDGRSWQSEMAKAAVHGNKKALELLRLVSVSEPGLNENLKTQVQQKGFSASNGLILQAFFKQDATLATKTFFAVVVQGKASAKDVNDYSYMGLAPKDMWPELKSALARKELGDDVKVALVNMCAGSYEDSAENIQKELRQLMKTKLSPALKKAIVAGLELQKERLADANFYAEDF